MTPELLIETALKYLDYPCLFAGKHPGHGYDPSGFHCSGYIIFLLKEIGFPLSPEILTSRDLFDFVGRLVHEECAARGDLVFSSRHGRHPTHVGILLGGDEYISSPGITDSKVCIRKIPKREFKPGPDIIYSRSPIGYKRLLPITTRNISSLN